MSAQLPARPGPSDERQRELYGESWSQRLRRLMAAYGLSQARLAGVIGLSAPMLSQLITGHRVKISNPAVYGRIVRLEELLDDPRVGAGDATVIAGVLDEVAASRPVLTTRSMPGPTDARPREAGAHSTAGADVSDADVAGHLAGLARREHLLAAADAAESAGGPALAALLRDAAVTPP